MANKCMNCGDPIFGRQDKKYCSTACKNEFHNHRPVKTHPWRKKVTEAIKRNHRILSELELQGVHSIAEKELEYSGFTLMGITGVDQAEEGKQLFFCYEYELQSDGQNMAIRNLDHLKITE